MAQVSPTLPELISTWQGLSQDQFGSNFNVSENGDYYRFNFPVLLTAKYLYDFLQNRIDQLDLSKAEDPYFWGNSANFLFQRGMPTNAITYQMQATNPVLGATADVGQLQIRKDNTDIVYINTESVKVDTVPFIFKAQCVTKGSVGNTDIGTVNTIQSTPSNWGDTFTNIAAFAGGQDLEELEEGRKRFFNQESTTSDWNEDGIYAELIKLSGVISVNIVQSRSDIDVDGVPRRAIHCVVEGGVDSEIIQALYNKVLPATYTLGAIRQDITTLAGDTVNIGFDRPTEIETEFQIEIYPSGTVPQSFIDAVIEYGDTVGIAGVASNCNATQYIKDNVDEASNYQHIGVKFKNAIYTTYTDFIPYGSNEKPVMIEGV